MHHHHHYHQIHHHHIFNFRLICSCQLSHATHHYKSSRTMEQVTGWCSQCQRSECSYCSTVTTVVPSFENRLDKHWACQEFLYDVKAHLPWSWYSLHHIYSQDLEMEWIFVQFPIQRFVLLTCQFTLSISFWVQLLMYFLFMVCYLKVFFIQIY